MFHNLGITLSMSRITIWPTLLTYLSAAKLCEAEDVHLKLILKENTKMLSAYNTTMCFRKASLNLLTVAGSQSMEKHAGRFHPSLYSTFNECLHPKPFTPRHPSKRGKLLNLFPQMRTITDFFCPYPWSEQHLLRRAHLQLLYKVCCLMSKCGDARHRISHSLTHCSSNFYSPWTPCVC